MITPSIKSRRQAVERTALIPQVHNQRQRRVAPGRKASGNPYTVSALAGPYQLETRLTPDVDQPTKVWFDATVQGQERRPAAESVLFLRITPCGEPHRVLAGLVSLADASSGYRHQA